MLSAGLTKGLTDQLSITPLSETSTFTDYAHVAVARVRVNATLEMGINGTDPGLALKNGLLSGATDALASYAAGQIGKNDDPTGQTDLNITVIDVVLSGRIL